MPVVGLLPTSMLCEQPLRKVPKHVAVIPTSSGWKFALSELEGLKAVKTLFLEASGLSTTQFQCPGPLLASRCHCPTKAAGRRGLIHAARVTLLKPAHTYNPQHPLLTSDLHTPPLPSGKDCTVQGSLPPLGGSRVFTQACSLGLQRPGESHSY